ncbi:MAG: homocysteine S-methyltransferase family protein [Oceanospirillaceae bacterium]|nr:homocysteine S-methyltransferase family protein [Oceanospirillaceae bacterium]
MVQYNNLYITDGGIETSLIADFGASLNDFACFPLTMNDEGRVMLKDYFEPYCKLAKQKQLGIVLETATWRASPDWAKKLGYSISDLAYSNVKAVELLRDLKAKYAFLEGEFVISGCIGPRGDGYIAEERYSLQELTEYHSFQTTIFKLAGTDYVSGITMNSSTEALALAYAALNSKIDCVISFTVETDGNLPSGESVESAINRIDQETFHFPKYYMLNCAHPTHFNHILSNKTVLSRIKGLRVNASKCSHEELDNSTELDTGCPEELSNELFSIAQSFKNLSIFGGCCGTNILHLTKIAEKLGQN